MNNAPNDKVVGAKRALTRRMSNSSLARRQLSQSTLPKQGRPSSINGEAPATAGGNKENGTDGETILQSPTPYWKVAKERGTVSPRETRGAKKRKTTGNESGGRTLSFDVADGIGQSSDQKRPGLMLFSPPDQVANAKREKLELDEKTRAR
jgi:hypothetical protein